MNHLFLLLVSKRSGAQIQRKEKKYICCININRATICSLLSGISGNICIFSTMSDSLHLPLWSTSTVTEQNHLIISNEQIPDWVFFFGGEGAGGGWGVVLRFGDHLGLEQTIMLTKPYRKATCIKNKFNFITQEGYLSMGLWANHVNSTMQEAFLYKGLQKTIMLTSYREAACILIFPYRDARCTFDCDQTTILTLPYRMATCI